MGTTGTSKSKLTLSVRPKYVAMLRRASARRGQSITELVEEIARQLETDTASTSKELWADRMNGRFAGGFTDADYQRTDLLGALLRKHLPKNRP
ncbi:MAG: hypothetical protein IT225_02780 [Flavobacteriales bacterium]|nr:hypothetical protein [Flavobacteriales bacterium]